MGKSSQKIMHYVGQHGMAKRVAYRRSSRPKLEVVRRFEFPRVARDL